MWFARGLVFPIVVALGAACASAPGPLLGPPPSLPEGKLEGKRRIPPEWYWEAVDADVEEGSGPRVAFPVTELVRLEGASRTWDELGAEGQDTLRAQGVVVVDRTPRAKMGALYTELRDQRVPYLVTLDALFYAVHLGLERALAEVDQSVLGPALDALLPALAERLGAEQRGADVEVGGGLRVARGVVAVAAALAGVGATPADLAPVVARELELVEAHAGPVTSPLLGVLIDYARLAAPPSAVRPGAFKALAWLGAAPFALVARSEVPGAIADVAAARTHARAALLVARLVDHDGEPKARDPYARIAKLLSFLWGAPDDIALPEYADAAEAASVNLANPEHVSSVTKIDRTRRRAAALRAPRLFDGSGAPGRAGLSVRVFGGHAPPDSIELARLSATRLPETAELSSWLALSVRPDDLHASVYGSLLDALGAWASSGGVGVGDETRREPSAAAAARRESTLAAWTWIRHAGQPLSRPPPSRLEDKELRVSGPPLLALVEPEPAVVGRLLATVRQMQRGLAALGPLPAGSDARATLAEVEDLLGLALRVAVREVRDEPLAPEDAAAMGSWPARLERLEGGDFVTVAADVASDLRAGRALTSATGLVERAVVVAREPGTGRLVLAVGAHVAHHEILEPLGDRTTDASLRARVDAGLPRAGYVSSFRRERAP